MTAVEVPATATGGAAKTSSSRWIPLTGVLFAVLLAASTLMVAGMPQAKNAAKVQAWDVKHTGLLGGAFLLTTLAVIVGVVFLTWLYSHLARDGGWMGPLFLAGVVVFAVSGTVSAGVEAALSSDAKHLSTTSLQLMARLDQNLNFPMTSAGLALMYLAAGFLIRRTGLLPGWLTWVSWLFALLAATVLLGFIPLLGTALWVIFAGIYLTARPPAQG
jgi:hypothetical protein